jgi:outer membrane protein OmpA-like peptidoglycan-associated protein
MKENADLRIEISGHTDNTGTDAINEKLSQARADAVKNYLLASGVASNRIQSKGYGSLKPIATNETEEGRQANRRVEFSIL